MYLDADVVCSSIFFLLLIIPIPLLFLTLFLSLFTYCVTVSRSRKYLYCSLFSKYVSFRRYRWYLCFYAAAFRRLRAIKSKDPASLVIVFCIAKHSFVNYAGGISFLSFSYFVPRVSYYCLMCDVLYFYLLYLSFSVIWFYHSSPTLYIVMYVVTTI